MPALPTSETASLERIERLEAHHLSGGGAVSFARLAVGREGAEGIAALNRRLPAGPGGPRLRHRHRRRRLDRGEATTSSRARSPAPASARTSSRQSVSPLDARPLAAAPLAPRAGRAAGGRARQDARRPAAVAARAVHARDAGGELAAAPARRGRGDALGPRGAGDPSGPAHPVEGPAASRGRPRGRPSPGALGGSAAGGDANLPLGRVPRRPRPPDARRGDPHARAALRDAPAAARMDDRRAILGQPPAEPRGLRARDGGRPGPRASRLGAGAGAGELAADPALGAPLARRGGSTSASIRPAPTGCRRSAPATGATA